MKEQDLKTVKDYIQFNKQKNPEKSFIICPQTKIEITNNALHTSVKKIHYLLRSKKQKKGSVICTLIENSLSSVQLMLGIMSAGLIHTPLNLIAGEDQLSYIVDHSDTNIIFASEGQYQLAKKISLNCNREIEIIKINKDTYVENLDNNFEKEEGNIEENDPALLMYTSGTTGKPKGVILSHKNIISGGHNVRISHELNHLDKALCVLPLFHINGLIVTVLGPLVSQSSVVLCERFSVTNFWIFLSKFKCTWFSVVPTIISALLNKYVEDEFKKLDLANVRFGRSASSALAPETHKKFEEKFNIIMIETMGLTETCAPILSNPLPPGKIKHGSPGLAYGNEVKILDSNFKEVEINTIGQICVKGMNVMKEYYKNSEETKKSFHNDWLLTGDLGLMDEDQYVFVRGRIKELIIKGGENISPREIDDVLYQHKDIVEAAAFAMPCEHYGEKIEAGVVLKEGSNITSDQVVEHCKTLIGEFKSPSKIHFLNELPKGPSGKIQRFKIKNLI